jgi:hypothetical protein
MFIDDIVKLKYEIICHEHASRNLKITHNMYY